MSAAPTSPAVPTAVQEAFLKAFHAERPAVTADAFLAGRAPDGRSSYEILSDRVAGARRVLDLGCGDGVLLDLLARTEGRRLAGVDLSPEALALARRRPSLRATALAQARAQRLPFPDGAFDACVCHMALMLMGDVDRVAAETARVLSPGGVLACVVGGGPLGGEAYELFSGLLKAAVQRAPAEQRIPPLGDRRTHSREGLGAILEPAGFGAPHRETVPIDLSGPVDQVWAALSGIYDVGPLDPAAVSRLRESFVREAAGLAGPDGRVPCGFTVHVVTARLR
ncbi:class I SAM-dependent methyltransferase [Streptomyces sp. NPDC056165]|uniref:class I SAM-dependent methyltransferase n=1 Tax=Streptomyces sp. NPDC056165 TaxID=3345733 RepID=UPI0035DC8F1F